MKRFLFYCLLLLGVTAQAQQIKSPKIGYDVSCNCISIQPTVGDTSIRVYLMAKDVFPIRSDATNGVYFQYTDGDTKTTLILRPATTFNLAGTAYSGNVTGLRTAIQNERNKLNAFAAQAATPPTPFSGVRLFSSANNMFSVLGSNGKVANFDLSGLSANRTYPLPDADGSLGGGAGTYLPLAGGTMTGDILWNASGTRSIGTTGNRALAIWSNTFNGTDVNATNFNGSNFTAQSPSGAAFALRKQDSGTPNQSGQTLFITNAHASGTSRNDGVISGTLKYQFSQPTSGTLQDAASIRAEADGIQSGNNTPTRLVFATSNTTSLADRFVITNSGANYFTQGSTLDFYDVGNNQATNRERVRMSWVSNAFTIAMEAAGTGLSRDIVLTTGAGSRTLRVNQTPGVNGMLNFMAATSGGGSGVGINTAHANASGIGSGLLISNTYTQSGTASYKSLWISEIETGTGSGTKLLIDAGTGGTGAHVTKFNVDNAGTITSAGNISISGSMDLVNDGRYIRFVNSGANGSISSTGGIFNITNSAGSDANDVFIIGNNATTGTRALRIQGQVIKFANGGGGTEYGRFFNDGNLFVGATPVNSGYKLEVGGTGRIGGQLDVTGNLQLISGRLVTTGNITSGVVDGSGVDFQNPARTINNTASAGTVAMYNARAFLQPTFTASAAQTYTVSNNFYIGPAPLASTNVTQGTANSLYVDGNTLINGALNQVGALNFSGRITGGGNFSSTVNDAGGVDLQIQTGRTFTNTTAAASSTTATYAARTFGSPTFANTNTSVTYTEGINVLINGAPTAGTNTTITTPIALKVNGRQDISGDINITGNHYQGGQGRFLGGLSVGTGSFAGTGILLDLVSTTKALAVPRMTKAQILAIASPSAGMVAYATDDAVLCYYNGTAWQKCTSSAL